MASKKADQGVFYTVLQGYHLNFSFILHYSQAQLKANIVKNSDPKHTTCTEKFSLLKHRCKDANRLVHITALPKGDHYKLQEFCFPFAAVVPKFKVSSVSVAEFGSCLLSPRYLLY